MKKNILHTFQCFSDLSVTNIQKILPIEIEYVKLRDVAPSESRVMGCISQLHYMDCLQIMRKWIQVVFISLSELPSLIYTGELLTEVL